MSNLLSSLPATLPDDQDENEFVLLIQGAARLRFEDSVLEMNPGGSCLPLSGKN
jgi:hypothetical protein